MALAKLKPLTEIEKEGVARKYRVKSSHDWYMEIVRQANKDKLVDTKIEKAT